jgi:hypothetical protein
MDIHLNQQQLVTVATHLLNLVVIHLLNTDIHLLNQAMGIRLKQVMDIHHNKRDMGIHLNKRVMDIRRHKNLRRINLEWDWEQGCLEVL